MIREMFIALLFCAVAYPTITYDNQYALLFSARQADIGEYFKATGVVVQDEPKMNPLFTGLRVESCNKRIWYFESTSVVLPCFATMADRISWQYYSHMRQVIRGINAFNAGNKSQGRTLIYNNVMEYIPIVEE